MRFAYADPPYPGMAHRYPENTEVDHPALIARLVEDFPDGWALSTSSVALRDVLVLCPQKTRICAWTKTWCSWKPGVGVVYAWEPVLFMGGRKRPRNQGTVRDWVACPADQSGFFGSKPLQFSFWLFEILGAKPEDELVDLFPGSGAVTKAWDMFQRQMTFRTGT